MSLADKIMADFVIVGAGYAGLMCALTLAKNGADVLLLDSQSIGGNSPPLPCHNQSSISGGHVTASFSQNYDDIAATYGLEYAVLLCNLGLRGVNLIEDLCRTYDMHDAAFRRGYVILAQNQRDERELELKIKRLKTYGNILSGPMIRNSKITQQKFISPAFAGASLYSPINGQLEPQAYVRGLAQAAVRYGARIEAPATVKNFRITDEGVYADIIGGGQVFGRRMIVCGGSQILKAGHFPAMRRYQAVVGNAAVRTTPLSDHIIAKIFPDGYEGAFADMRHSDVMYGRLDSQKRLDFGTSSFAGQRPNIAYVERNLYRIFPQLQEAGIEIEQSRYGFLVGTRQEFVQFFQSDETGAVQPTNIFNPHSPITVLSAFAAEGINLGTTTGEAMALASLGQPKTFNLLAQLRHSPLPVTFQSETFNRLRDYSLATTLSCIDHMSVWNNPIGGCARKVSTWI